MDEYMNQIKAAMDSNKALKERTPWLDVSLGGLRTALENAQEHVDALARKAAAKPATDAAQ